MIAETLPLSRKTDAYKPIDKAAEPPWIRDEKDRDPKEAPWFDEKFNYLVSLMHLPSNWDGEQGLPLKPECRDEALYILMIASSMNAPKPHISPTPDGGASFEFSHAGRELELEVEADLSLSVLREDEKGEYSEKQVPIDLLEREIRWLLRGY